MEIPQWAAWSASGVSGKYKLDVPAIAFRLNE